MIEFTETIIAKTNAFANMVDGTIEFLSRHEPMDRTESNRHQLSNGWWLYSGPYANQAVQYCEQLAELAGLNDDDWSFEYHK